LLLGSRGITQSMRYVDSLASEINPSELNKKVEAAWQLSSNLTRAVNLNLLLARSGFITLHVSVVPATLGFINE